MAIKPTIYKFRISLSDLNQNYYDTLNLTIALHPSETLERMMARVLAYCLNAYMNSQEHLSFTRGLCDVDEPDIWLRSLDDQVLLWIDIGEPSTDRIKKATHIAEEVKVYSFNSKSGAWWEQEKNKLARLKTSIYQFQWENIQSLARLVERTMDISVTLTANSVYVAAPSGECEIICNTLKEL